MHLTGTTTVLSALKTEPRLANFGKLDRDAEAQTRTVKLKRGDGGPINPSIVSTGNKAVQAEIKEVTKGEEYELVVKIEPPFPNRMLRGAITLATGVEKAPRESVTVYASITPRLQTRPNRFMVRPNTDKDLTLTSRLQWSDNDPGKILGVECTDPQLKVTTERKGNYDSVVLSVPAGYNPPRRTGHKVVIRTNDKEVPEVQIPIYVIKQRHNRRNQGTRTGQVKPVTPPSRRHIPGTARGRTAIDPRTLKEQRAEAAKTAETQNPHGTDARKPATGDKAPGAKNSPQKPDPQKTKETKDKPQSKETTKKKAEQTTAS